MNHIHSHDAAYRGTLRAHTTPDPESPNDPTPPHPTPPVPDDVPDPVNAPVEEPRLPEPPIRVS
jgi:protein TonB